MNGSRHSSQAGGRARQHAQRAHHAQRARAFAKKKDTTMSQMTSFVKAVKAWLKVRVLVAMAVVTARKAQAPTGSGSSTRPAQAGGQRVL